MIQRDFILRQIQQLVQVIAYVLNLKRDGRFQEARDEIDNALPEVFGIGLKDLLDLSKEDLLALCKENEQFHAEKALALAELLEERGDLEKDESIIEAARCFESALLLYEALVASGAAVPIDIYDRINRLKT